MSNTCNNKVCSNYDNINHVTVVKVEEIEQKTGHNMDDFVTVVQVGDMCKDQNILHFDNTVDCNASIEEINIYRLPGEKLGMGLKFDGGTNANENINKVFIQSINIDSPASKAYGQQLGFLREGDEIIEIDSSLTQNLTRLQCITLLKDAPVCIKIVVKRNLHNVNGNHGSSYLFKDKTIVDESETVNNCLSHSNQNSLIKKIPPPVPPRKETTILSSKCLNQYIPQFFMDNETDNIVKPFRKKCSQPPPLPPRRPKVPPPKPPTEKELKLDEQIVIIDTKEDTNENFLENLTFVDTVVSDITDLINVEDIIVEKIQNNEIIMPSEPSVYTDLLADEDIMHIESESDDTGSSVSTIIERFSRASTANSSFSDSIPRKTTVDIGRVLSPFEHLERELDHKETLHTFVNKANAAFIEDENLSKITESNIYDINIDKYVDSPHFLTNKQLNANSGFGTENLNDIRIIVPPKEFCNQKINVFEVSKDLFEDNVISPSFNQTQLIDEQEDVNELNSSTADMKIFDENEFLLADSDTCSYYERNISATDSNVKISNENKFGDILNLFENNHNSKNKLELNDCEETNIKTDDLLINKKEIFDECNKNESICDDIFINNENIYKNEELIDLISTEQSKVHQDMKDFSENLKDNKNFETSSNIYINSTKENNIEICSNLETVKICNITKDSKNVSSVSLIPKPLPSIMPRKSKSYGNLHSLCSMIPSTEKKSSLIPRPVLKNSLSNKADSAKQTNTHDEAKLCHLKSQMKPKNLFDSKKSEIGNCQSFESKIPINFKTVVRTELNADSTSNSASSFYEITDKEEKINCEMIGTNARKDNNIMESMRCLPPTYDRQPPDGQEITLNYADLNVTNDANTIPIDCKILQVPVLSSVHEDSGVFIDIESPSSELDLNVTSTKEQYIIDSTNINKYDSNAAYDEIDASILPDSINKFDNLTKKFNDNNPSSALLYTEAEVNGNAINKPTNSNSAIKRSVKERIALFDHNCENSENNKRESKTNISINDFNSNVNTNELESSLTNSIMNSDSFINKNKNTKNDNLMEDINQINNNTQTEEKMENNSSIYSSKNTFMHKSPVCSSLSDNVLSSHTTNSNYQYTGHLKPSYLRYSSLNSASETSNTSLGIGVHKPLFDGGFLYSLLETRKQNATKLKGLIIPDIPSSNEPEVCKSMPTIFSNTCSSSALLTSKPEEVTFLTKNNTSQQQNQSNYIDNQLFTSETESLLSKYEVPKYSPAFKRRQLELPSSPLVDNAATINIDTSCVDTSTSINANDSQFHYSLSHSKPVIPLIPETALISPNVNRCNDKVQKNAFLIDDHLVDSALNKYSKMQNETNNITNLNENKKVPIVPQRRSSEPNNLKLISSTSPNVKADTYSLHNSSVADYWDSFSYTKENDDDVDGIHQISTFDSFKPLSPEISKPKILGSQLTVLKNFTEYKQNTLKSDSTDSVKNFKALAEKWEQKINCETVSSFGKNVPPLPPPKPLPPSVSFNRMPPSLMPKNNKMNSCISNNDINVSNYLQSECFIKNDLKDNDIYSNIKPMNSTISSRSRSFSDICRVFEQNTETQSIIKSNKSVTNLSAAKNDLLFNSTILENVNEKNEEIENNWEDCKLKEDSKDYFDDINEDSTNGNSLDSCKIDANYFDDDKLKLDESKCCNKLSENEKNVTLNNHHRMSSIDSIASDSGASTSGVQVSKPQGSHTGSSSNLRDSQFGSVSSLASTTSLISPQELQQLIEEANQSLEVNDANSHNIQVIVLHREYISSGNIGITLAGGSDCETKEITVHRVINGSLADRDGRIKKGDRILSINGKILKGVTHKMALEIMKSPRPEVVIVLSRTNPEITNGFHSRQSSTDLTEQINSTQIEDEIITGQKEIENNSDNNYKIIRADLAKDVAGLGFILEGGKDSPLGDKPLAIKKIFRGGPADKEGTLSAGDEIISVNDLSFNNMTRTEAWNFLKKLPEGQVILIVKRKKY